MDVAEMAVTTAAAAAVMRVTTRTVEGTRGRAAEEVATTKSVRQKLYY